MKRILVTDDSKVDRSIVAQSLRKKFEVLEAESGTEALEILAATAVDLIILDVNMPGQDGSTTLREIRKQGVVTPVVLLTAEVRTSVITTMMNHGIANYIVKPVSPRELLAKISSVLQMGDVDDGQQTADVLMVDDMPNVVKRFVDVMPEGLHIVGAGSAEEALAVARSTSFKVVIVDMEIPNVDSSILMSRIKVFQPDAAVYGLYLRDVGDCKAEAARMGIAGYLHKPFDVGQIRNLLATHFDLDSATAMTVVDNVLKVNAFPEARDERGLHALKLRHMALDSVRAIAAACYDVVIVDMSTPPPTEQLLGIVTTFQKISNDIGLNMELIISLQLQRLISTTSETADLVMFETRETSDAAA